MPKLMDISRKESTGHLPMDIRAGIEKLLVDRRGLDSNAYMVTEDIASHVVPDKPYILESNGFRPIHEDKPEKPLPNAQEPPYTTVQGLWLTEEQTVDSLSGNILGGYGRLIVDSDAQKIEIPIAQATAEMLAFYGAKLVKMGEVVKFEATGNLPVTTTSVGQTYVENFLMQDGHGGGAYLEYHDRPHFHMPLDPEAGGFLVLGNQEKEGSYRLSAFNIPFGYGISMAPYTIHTDAYLIGRFLVIYSVTEKFSTVLLRNRNDQLTKLSIAHRARCMCTCCVLEALEKWKREREKEENCCCSCCLIQELGRVQTPKLIRRDSFIDSIC